jgi:CheY-like chemotaxis protein
MSQKKILIVEDENITLALTRKLLEAEGYEVVETKDGSNAVSLVMTAKPDLVLLDLGLPPADPFTGPNFDGFIVMDWLKRMMREAQVPVIVITAQTGSNLRQRALDAGASEFLQKPVDKHSLLATIRSTLGESETIAPACPA